MQQYEVFTTLPRKLVIPCMRMFEAFGLLLSSYHRIYSQYPHLHRVNLGFANFISNLQWLREEMRDSGASADSQASMPLQFHRKT